MTGHRETADVSVIVAAYQARDTIGRALRSIARQTLKPAEVVVVDDGSTDGTFEAAEAMRPEMADIRLHVVRTERNRGAGAARNRAIAESSQPWLAFLDADDEWLPEKLQRSLARIEDTDAVLVAHDYLTSDGETAYHHHCERRFREHGDPFVGLYRKGYIPSCSVVARREAVLAAGGFDPGLRNAQDFDLWLAMLREPGTPFQVFGEPLLRYHQGPGGIMSHTRRRLRCGPRHRRAIFSRSRGAAGLAVRESLVSRRRAAPGGDPCLRRQRRDRPPARDRRPAPAAAAGDDVPVPAGAAVATRPVSRPSRRSDMNRKTPDKDGLWAALSWLWVIAVTVAYLYQFRDFVRPILAHVGLA